jgi:DNA-binding FadR family transcriptional regulator
METKISKKSLADEVASRLQQQISLGVYKPNEKLPVEPELMKIFGVGRSTIREAVKNLTNSGLLRVQQGVGTFVEEITDSREPLGQRLKRANFDDLDEVRQLLEMKIAEKAARNRLETDLADMKRCLTARKNAAKEGSVAECIDADIQFHTAIAEACKNPILVDIYKAASVHLKKWFLHLYKDTSVFVQSQRLHEQLFESIVAADAKKAWHYAAKINGHIQ